MNATVYTPKGSEPPVGEPQANGKLYFYHPERRVVLTRVYISKRQGGGAVKDLPRSALVGASVDLNGDGSWNFGGQLHREVGIMKEHGPGLPFQTTWDDLISPISAWEAWVLALRKEQTLQGIRLFKDDGKPITVALDRPDSYGLTIWKGALIGSVKILMDTYPEHLPPIPVLDNLANSSLVERAGRYRLQELLFLDSYFKFIEFGGWSLSPIWRLEEPVLSLQAKVWKTTSGALLDRMQSRRNAVDRKQEEMERP